MLHPEGHPKVGHGRWVSIHWQGYGEEGCVNSLWELRNRPSTGAWRACPAAVPHRASSGASQCLHRFYPRTLVVAGCCRVAVDQVRHDLVAKHVEVHLGNSAASGVSVMLPPFKNSA